MKQIGIDYFIFLCVSFSMAVNPYSIEITHANSADFQALIAFDRKVTFEFFKPMYLAHYTQFEFGTSPEPFLELEVSYDEETFMEFIEKSNGKRFYKALIHDKESTVLAGILTCHINEDSELYLQLLLVDAPFRRLGIGKQLIIYAIADSPEIIACVVEPLKYANDAAINFYQSLGFKRYPMPQPERINAYGVKFGELYDYYRLIIN